MHSIRYVFLSCLSLIVFSTYAQTAIPPTKSPTSTLYHCTLADGSAQYATSEVSKNCVAIGTFKTSKTGSSGAAPGTAVLHTSYGDASKTCGDWTQSRKGPNVIPTDFMVSWAAGYLSATARLSPEMRATDSGAILGYLDSYCEKHPLSTIEQATVALSRELGSK